MELASPRHGLDVAMRTTVANLILTHEHKRPKKMAMWTAHLRWLFVQAAFLQVLIKVTGVGDDYISALYCRDNMVLHHCCLPVAGPFSVPGTKIVPLHRDAHVMLAGWNVCEWPFWLVLRYSLYVYLHSTHTRTHTHTHTEKPTHTHTHTHTHTNTQKPTHTHTHTSLHTHTHTHTISHLFSIPTHAQQCLLRRRKMQEIAWPVTRLTSTPLLSLSSPIPLTRTHLLSSCPPLHCHYRQPTLCSSMSDMGIRLKVKFPPPPFFFFFFWFTQLTCLIHYYSEAESALSIAVR